MRLENAFLGTLALIVSIEIEANHCLARAADSRCVEADGNKGDEQPDRATSVIESLASNAPPGNAGLFVGINSFTKEGSERIAPLRFAVDDAMALAHLFCLELKILAPTQTWLAIEGNPTHPELRDVLEKAGVRISNANKSDILKALSEVAPIDPKTGLGLRKPEDLVIVSFSSHGTIDKEAYLLASDTVLSWIPDTAIAVSKLQEALYRCQAGKRLIIADACRDRSLAGGRGGAAGASPEFLRALASARGEAVFVSCEVEEIAYEDEHLKHGVFTHFFVEALRGAAEADEDGLIRLRNVQTYLRKTVPEYVQRTRGTSQSPDLNSGTAAGAKIPLAINRPTKNRAEDRRRKLVQLLDEKAITPDQFTEGRKLLEESPADLNPVDRRKREVFVDLMESRVQPRDFGAVIGARGIAPTPLLRLQEAAESGDVFAQLQLARLYFESEMRLWLESRSVFQGLQKSGDRFAADMRAAGTDPSLQPSDQTAVVWLQRAVDSGTSRAATVLGLLSEFGRCGLAKDEAKAAELYKKSADAGDAHGMVYLGHLYANGKGGLAKDQAKAVELYRRSADAGDSRGMLYFGLAYEYGEGGLAKDQTKAVELYKKSAEAGDPRGMAYLGVAYEYGQGGVAKDESKALELYKKSAEAGDTRGMLCLGLSYENGQGGLAKDEAKAVELYKKSAVAGDPRGMALLGVAYEYERLGLAKDEAKAVELYKKSADAGDTNGMYRLGDAYEQGKGGLAKDIAKAVELYKKSAEAGGANAMYRLGDAYETGKSGLAKDEAKAVALYKKSADAGDLDGMYRLGDAYEMGKGGLSRDLTLAKSWYRSAAKLGHSSARDALQRLGP